jgi:hypothetical protein
MKNITLIALTTLLAAMVPNAAYSAALNNSANFLEQSDFYMGVETFFVGDRDIKESDSGAQASFSTDQYFVVIGYAPLEVTVVDIRFGIGNIRVEDTDFDFYFDYGIAWGASIHQQLLSAQKYDLQAGISAHYFMYGAENEDPIRSDEFPIKPEGNEWILSAEVTKGFGIVVVRGGVRYSNLEIKIEDFVSRDVDEVDPEINTDLKFKQKDEFAAILGAEIKVSDDFRISGEAQFLDGEALALRAIYIY